MTRWKWNPGWMLGLLIATLLLAACQPTQAWQDTADQGELRRLFNIPTNAELVSYQGYPVMVGFGQREGLSLSAVYRLSGVQVQDFIAQAGARGWQVLPIPPELRAAIPWKGLPVPLETASGFYLCQTAGDDVLHAAKTKSCAETPPTADIILGVLELPLSRGDTPQEGRRSDEALPLSRGDEALPGGQLSVTVRSAY